MNQSLLKCVAFVAACSLAACDNGGGGDSKGGTTGTLGNDGAKITTDTSVCRSGPPATSIVGSWGFSMANSSPDRALTINEEIVLNLNPDGSGSITNNCQSNTGDSVAASVPLTYTINGNTFAITSASSITEKSSDGNLSCSVSTKSLGSSNYSFQGSCLVLQGTGSSAGQALTMVPDGGQVTSTQPPNPVLSSPSTNPTIQAAQDKCQNTPQQTPIDLRYVYSQTINGNSCTTGCQIFTDQSSYCQALQNDALNNYCAKDERTTSYQQAHCAGN